MPTIAEIRAGFDSMIAAARRDRNHDAVARLELLREYTTNSVFREWLQDTSFALTCGRTA